MRLQHYVDDYIFHIHGKPAYWTLFLTQKVGYAGISQWTQAAIGQYLQTGSQPVLSSRRRVQSARLNSTQLNQFWKCSELRDWQKLSEFQFFFGWVKLTWVVSWFRHPTRSELAYNSTQLNSTQLTVELSWVELSRALWIGLNEQLSYNATEPRLAPTFLWPAEVKPRLDRWTCRCQDVTHRML